MSIFKTEADPWEGADSDTRKALSAYRKDHPALKRLLAALVLARIPHETPFWRPHAWAHVGLPDLKRVLVIGQSVYWIRARLFYDKWAEYKFKVAGIAINNLMNNAIPHIAEELASTINEERK